MSQADWGDTWSSPLLSVVALGSITVAGGVGGGRAGERFNVSVSSRTLTRLLIVSRIFSTLYGACGSRTPSMEEDGGAVVAIYLAELRRGRDHFSLGMVVVRGRELPEVLLKEANQYEFQDDVLTEDKEDKGAEEQLTLQICNSLVTID